MKKIILLISAFAFSIVGVLAQNGRVVSNQNFPSTVTQRTCATMDVYETFIQNHPESGTIENFNDWIAPQVDAYLQSIQNGGQPEQIYTIPVIVHVIHNSSESVGQGRNIPYTRVTEQLQVLNDDFRRTNADATNTPASFSGIAADCQVNFCLIQTYPTGHAQAGQTLPEIGVDRVDAAAAGFGNTTTGYSTATINATIKPATSWNPNEVLNIWVLQLQSGLLGYAQFPNTGVANTDGVAIAYNYFGLTGGTFGLGRTTTHEVGHYLGLYHIWGDDGTACTGSDLVSDTPNQGGSTNSCPSGVQTDACATSAPGYMYQNYMDYTFDACMNMLTLGQKARIQSTMATAPRRSTLDAASTTLCSAGALTANFTESATVINAGQTITFTDASGGPNPLTTWSWNFDVGGLGGVTPSTTATQGPHVVTFNTVGVYSVSLTVGDGTSTNAKVKTSYITVNAVGTAICDSTAANWAWSTETFGAAYWGQDNAACAQPLAGLIVGNNCYNDNGWASKVTFSATGKELTDVLYTFVRSSGTGAASLKVWDNTGAAGAPGAVIASMTTTTGAYSANLNQFISMPVSPAVALNGNFYIGYDHSVTPITGDSLCMGVSTGTTGNQAWAKETAGWKDLSAYGVNYKGTVVAVICNITTGEKEILGEINEIAVFPNPSLGTINVALTSKAKSTVKIYNVVGKLIYSNNLNTQLVTVDVSNQPNGIYFVNIETDNSITTKKVILSK